jgi:phytanoyl-CoA hydroxylase
MLDITTGLPADIASQARFSCEASGVTASARAFFEANGFVIFTSHADVKTTSVLRAAATALVHAHPPPPAAAPFSTTCDQARASDEHFLGSACTVRSFREELADAFAAVGDPSVTTNKLGHALHDLVPEFARFSYGDGVRTVAVGLLGSEGGAGATVVQSMVIFKQPRIGGPVLPHRDGTFISTTEDTAQFPCLGFWWALQDSTLDNGCLWAVPGSHIDGIPRRFQMTDAGNATEFVGEDAACSGYTRDMYVPLPMDEGDLIVLHGALVHMSLDNVSSASRHAYSIHIVDARSRYSPRSWLQRDQSLPFHTLANPPAIAANSQL